MKTFQVVVLLTLFWLVLAASLDPLEIAVGFLLASLVGAWAGKALWRGEEPPSLSAAQAARLIFYLPYLAKEIVVACVQVAVKVLDPRLPIDPLVIACESSLRRPVSRVALANSITLTPGTLTVDLEGSTFLVHCLDREFAGAIREGKLEKRIADIFEEA